MNVDAMVTSDESSVNRIRFYAVIRMQEISFTGTVHIHKHVRIPRYAGVVSSYYDRFCTETLCLPDFIHELKTGDRR
jgi:hypothetical protein